MYLSVELNGGQCCLTNEICSFQYVGYPNRWAFANGEGTTHQEAAAAVIKRIKEKVHSGEDEFEDQYEGSQVFFFWFKKTRDYRGDLPENWEFEELRQELLKEDKVTCLGEFDNSNSNNHLIGYMWQIDLEGTRRNDADED